MHRKQQQRREARQGQGHLLSRGVCRQAVLTATPSAALRCPSQSKGRHSAALDLLHTLSQRPEELPAPAQGASAGELCAGALALPLLLLLAVPHAAQRKP